MIPDVKPCDIAWLDEDGEHVWFRHRCRVGVVVTMLPNDWHARTGEPMKFAYPYVWPSVVCDRCTYHYWPQVLNADPGDTAIHERFGS